MNEVQGSFEDISPEYSDFLDKFKPTTRAAAERAAAHRWQLSERERAMVAMLDAREERAARRHADAPERAPAAFETVIAQIYNADCVTERKPLQ